MAKDYTQEANATLERWRRQQEKYEKDHEAAKAGMSTLFEQAIKKDIIRQRVDAELREIRQSGKRPSFKDEAGFNLIDDDYDELVDGKAGY